MKLESYYVGGPVKGLCKSYAIWGTDVEGSSYPLAYLKKPKWIEDVVIWENIIKSIELRLKQNFEINQKGQTND